MIPLQKLRQICNALSHRTARVLAYHGISDQPDDPFAVSPEVFRQQMTWLAASGLRVIKHTELERAIRSGENVGGLIILTFDDALTDFYDAAVPILTDLGLPATIFVPTGLIGKLSTWMAPGLHRMLMSQEQLYIVNRKGFLLGSHTVNHVDISACSDEELELELKDSLACIRSITGKQEVAFAYPYGRSETHVALRVRDAGYSSAYLAGGLWGSSGASDFFALPRSIIKKSTSWAEFINLVTGQSDVSQIKTDVQSNILTLLTKRR